MPVNPVQRVRRVAVSAQELLVVLTVMVSACSHDGTGPSRLPAKFVFTTPPSTAMAGASLAAVVVTAEDSTGQVDGSFTGRVTMALGADPDGGTLSGTLVVAAIGGIATFSDLSIDKADTGYTLVATSSGATAIASSGFAITAGGAVGIAAVAGISQSGPVLGALPNSVGVKVTDQLGNGVAGASVTWTVASGHGTVGTPSSQTDASGIATNTWVLGGVVGIQALTAALSGGTRAVTITAEAVALPFATLTAGRYHTCGLNTLGAVYCWGDGPLGEGTTVGSNFVTYVALGFRFDTLTAGSYYTCGLTAQGAAYCWGATESASLGDGVLSEETTLPGLVMHAPVFASLSAAPGGDSNDHTCGLATSGAAYCWGHNYQSELGDGTDTLRYSPTAVSGGLTFVSLRSGAASTCALTAAGSMYCWGDNTYGEVGDSTVTERHVPTLVAGGLTFTSFATELNNVTTCALATGGTAYCWGYNDLGGVGDGTTTDRDAPTMVGGGLVFKQISAGGFHTCGLTTAGAAYCWGDNSYGAVGDGTTVRRLSPTPVAGGLAFSYIAAGTYHTCALTADGVAYCWGDNILGELGDGTRTTRLVPTQVVMAPDSSGARAKSARVSHPR